MFGRDGRCTVTESSMSEAEFARQMKSARRRGKETGRAPTRIVSVHYANKLIHVEFANGFRVSFPAKHLPELEQASEENLANVAVDPSGEALRWDAIDLDVAVLGLLFEAFESTPFFSQLGCKGGSAKSKAKAAAARANGLKGGRPRKQGVMKSKKKTKDLPSGARRG
jgi:hypothetical protein